MNIVENLLALSLLAILTAGQQKTFRHIARYWSFANTRQAELYAFRRIQNEACSLPLQRRGTVHTSLGEFSVRCMREQEAQVYVLLACSIAPKLPVAETLYSICPRNNLREG